LTRSRRHLGSALSAALVAVLVIAAGPRQAVGATDTRVRLEYQADEQGACVGADDLRRMVTDQLGHDPFRSDADQQVAISIAKTEIGFQGRIVWREADGRQVGERLLSSRSRDCREIAANVAFAVALQLQLVERGSSDDAGAGTADGSTPQTTGPPDGVAVIPERPSVSTEAPAVPREESSPPLRLAVGAGPAVAIGMTPDATAFGRLFVVARLRRLSGEIAGDAALPTTLEYRDGTGVAVNALGFTAATCAHAEIISACLLGRLGWLRAHGTGIALPRTSWGHFGEVGTRVAATKELGEFTVSVHADGLVMLSHWNVVLNDAVVWDVPRVGVVVGLDVALRFF
jgi:hypothetical protein